MTSPNHSTPRWDDSSRLAAAEKWKAKSAAMGRAVTEALIEYAQPKSGMKVLDLASGMGEPGITLAALVGPEGRVSALDQSAELLQIAVARARERGLANFSVREADAHHLPFPDASFDLITCRFGAMFFQQPAFREAHRVLKSGARACFLVWGPFEKQPYHFTTMGVVHKHVGGALLPKDQDPFKYAQPDSLSAALRRAGFTAVEEETRSVPWAWPGPPEEVWEYERAVAAPFRPLLARIPPAKWDEINAEVLATVSRYVQGDSVNFGAVVVLAAATKT